MGLQPDPVMMIRILFPMYTRNVARQARTGKVVGLIEVRIIELLDWLDSDPTLSDHGCGRSNSRILKIRRRALVGEQEMRLCRFAS